MTYTQKGDTITLEMTQADYDELTLTLGLAAGSTRGHVDDEVMFWRIIQFANAMNRTNPNFRQYKVPPKFRDKSGRSSTKEIC